MSNVKNAVPNAKTALPTRRAGNSSLLVSMMGLGCMGMSEFYGEKDDNQSRDLLNYAVDKGVRFFDTADVYGYGHNEILVGSVLRNHPKRSDIVLATKGGIVRDDNDSTRRGVNTSPEYLQAAIERSLSRLETKIDLYYLHRVEDDGARIEESMSALADQLLAGHIGAVGLSEVSEQTIRRAHAALLQATDGKYGLAAIQTEFSLMTRHIEANGVDQACRELGILLVAYSPICRGLLTAPSFNPEALSESDFRRNLPRFTGDNLKHNLQLVEVLATAAKNEGLTPAQVALAWVMAQGNHVVPIPGTRSKARLDENIAACEAKLSPETMALLAGAFAPQAVAGLRYTPAAMQAYGLSS
ncbi:aldo/keto reductase [Advenella mimigardefordensis]|uniref:Putative aldo-keto reductase n=1 Tax=Advenella mimigardefordensis (strain DSM 17166 / LMG 22922 / DPN7) TaxID=1247726 RepID=W0PIS2_ADVMD|nr:aldo/keto reductase [Advenella mimigardefordensis]AHG65430.1 putative aldo-keto reductase [Advenella mimigardefordensis DPN7]